MTSPAKSASGTPRSKRKIDYKPLEVDVKVVERLRVTNQVINSEADGGINFNRNWKNAVKTCNKIVSNMYFQGVMGIFSVFSLYAADIAILVNEDKEVYEGFETGLSIAFFLFLLEIILTSIAKREYFQWPDSFERQESETLFQSLKRRLAIGSFYFYLELLGTLTILVDMSWAVGETQDNNDPGVQVADRGGRAGRVVRLMRIMRFFQLDRYVHRAINALKGLMKVRDDEAKDKDDQSKALESANKDGRHGVRFDLGEEQKDESDLEYGEKKDTGTEEGAADEENQAGRSRSQSTKKRMSSAHEAPSDAAKSDDSPPASLVGATMTDLTHMRIISVVLVLLIVIPLLTVNDPDTSHLMVSSMIHVTAYDAYSSASPRSPNLIYNILTVINMQAVEYLETSVRSEKPKLPIMDVKFSPSILFNSGDSESLSTWTNTSYANVYVRSSDKLTVEKVTGSFTTTLTFDNRSEVMDHAEQSIYTTSFVLVVLFFGTYFFTQTVNRLVIDPIETMVALVTKISENPLGVDYDKEHGINDGFLDGMETTILLNTINKIGGLMRVGFGEAGASIIADNLKNAQGANLNLMTAGRMIHSIFGFCDVRQFTDTTECLQEEVMLFVNRIAHILHSIVTQCSGSANKNIGDAFLLTWKLEDDMTADEQAFLADQALLTFCKALVELGRYQEFICDFSKAANDRLYARFPGYLVRIGSGLHVGWAIEGAIGSNRKIDASYLSPHVNFTEYLESSTKAYGVPLLISEQFYSLLSEEVLLYVRKVDRVRTNPAEDPVALYTYDSDLSLKWPKKSGKKLVRRRSSAPKTPMESTAHHRRHSSLHPNKKGNVDDDDSNRGGGKKRRQSLHSQLKDDNAPGSDSGGGSDIEAGSEMAKEELPEITVKPYDFDVWEKDPELILLRHMAYQDPKFRPLWDTGIEAYLAGDWPTAHHIFNDCLELTNNKCGPSKFLLKEINDNGGIAPEDWDGYRVDF